MIRRVFGIEGIQVLEVVALGVEVSATEIDVAGHDIDAEVAAAVADEGFAGNRQQPGPGPHVQNRVAFFAFEVQHDQRLEYADDVAPLDVRVLATASIPLGGYQPDVSAAANELSIQEDVERVE